MKKGVTWTVLCVVIATGLFACGIKGGSDSTCYCYDNVQYFRHGYRVQRGSTITRCHHSLEQFKPCSSGVN